MAKGQKNQKDRTEREADRRRRDEERARERAEREAERAREREEREREDRDDDDTPQEPGLVLASVQVFNQMPPYQLYVLSNGQTIATPETPGDLIDSVRRAIWEHFVAAQPEPQEPEDTVEEEPLEPAGDDIPVEVLDDDGNSPEDFTALESAPLPPRNQALTIPLPDGMDPDAASKAVTNALARLKSQTQKEGLKHA